MAIEREVVAYHEAGHAVVAHALGFPVESISTNSDGFAAGYVTYNYGENWGQLVYGRAPQTREEEEEERRTDSEAEAAKRQRKLEHVAMIALAGEIAQARFRPESVDEAQGEGDRESLETALSHLTREVGQINGPNDRDAELFDAWERLLRIRVTQIIEEHWRRIQWVAEVLLQQQEIEGVEAAKHAILDGDLPPEHRGKRLSPRDRLAPSVGRLVRDVRHDT
jgi:hypothetical protein